MGVVEKFYFFAVVTIAIVLYFIFAGPGKHRADQIKKIADKLGFSFANPGKLEILDQLKELRIFQVAEDSQQIGLALHKKTSTANWEIFDYQYSVCSGRRSATYIQTVACVTIKDLNLPHFFIEPESFLDRLGEKLKKKDIVFEEYPDFSKNYVLQADDEQEIKKLFTLDIIAFFENSKKALTIEVLGDKIVIYYLKTEVLPNELGSFFAEAEKIVKIFCNRKTK